MCGKSGMDAKKKHFVSVNSKYLEMQRLLNHTGSMFITE